MFKFLEKIFGNKHEKDVKRLLPVVDEINEEYAKLSSLSDNELRGKTAEFRALIAERTAAFRPQIEELRNRLRTETVSHEERLEIYTSITNLEDEEYEIIQSTLDELLPQAFAVVKETCRRLVGHNYSVVSTQQTWDMVPYDVQLIGGIILHEGKIAEMATGEGKTLVAVMPLYLNALPGRGVHLVTVNDYLALRDKEWMQPVFDFHGISVGCIQSNMHPSLRKNEYEQDITYGTNNEFGFDYLRDNMVGSMEDMVQRPHNFAVVDEVDSVLIDEARTPLIISGPVGHSDQRFEEMNPIVRSLVSLQTRLVAKLVADAETLLKGNSKEDKANAGLALLRAHRGFPKNKRLMKLLAEPENMKLLQDTELEYLRDQGRKMHEVDQELYYSVDEKNHQIDLTEKGRTMLAGSREDKDFFLLPDLATEFSMMEGNTDLNPDDKQLRKDELLRIYAERADRIHTVNQLLRAYTLYERDDEYVVDDGKIKIVDEFTGRILDGRRYSDGLHQAIEAKENVTVERDTQTLATITLQNYFRLYRKLGGMTGTAETEAAEFMEIYNLDCVVIPTNKPISRKDENDLVFRTKREKFNAVAEEVGKQVAQGRAVLVGTTSVETSELLSKMLKRVNIKHNVLNAKQHQYEAEIVANAGQPGAVMIATNMAGRGTDIKLHPKVKEAGGLCIIGTERHESRRIDRQLRGRAGRQGDPGSSRFFISLEDDLMRLFKSDRIAAVMQRLNMPEGEPIEHSMVTKSVENAQKKVEQNNFGIRKRLLEYDNVMNQQRTVIYDRRKHALMGERLRGELFEYIDEIAMDMYAEFHPNALVNECREALRSSLLCDIEMDAEQFRTMDEDTFVRTVVDEATEFYNRKEERLGAEFMSQLERVAVLQTIDDKWREHLRDMDELKEGIHLRAYGQKDPLLEYKSEAFKLFSQLVKDINKGAVEFAFRYFPQVVERVETVPVDILPPTRTVSMAKMQFSHPSVAEEQAAAIRAAQSEQYSDNGVEGGEAPPRKQVPFRVGEKMQRNDPCPFDENRKFKHCCGSLGHKTCVRAQQQ